MATNNKSSLNFNGTNSYALSTKNIGLSGNPSFTIEAWVYLSTIQTDYSAIISTDAYSSSACLSITMKDGKPALDIFNYRVQTSTPLAIGKWYHIAITKTANTTLSAGTTIYINGVKQVVTVVDGTPNLTNTTIVIGRLNVVATRYFNGKIDELRIWNTVRTQSEIVDNMNMTLDGNTDGLLTYYRFDENKGITTNDSSPNTNHLTLYNTTWGRGEIDLKSLRINKCLLSSSNKIYALESIDTVYETKMTSNIAPAPLIASANSETTSTYPAWRAFAYSNPVGSFWNIGAVSKGWVQIDYGVAKKVNFLSLFSTNESDGNATTRSPKRIEIQGSNNGTSFDTLAIFDDILYAKANEQKDFKFNNENEYRYYRLHVEKNRTNYLGVGKVLYGYKKPTIKEIPNASANNFNKYGKNLLINVESTFINKEYILQDIASEDVDGLWKAQLNRKPLSIGIEVK